MSDSRVYDRRPTIAARPPLQRHDSPLNARLDEIGHRARTERGLPASVSDPAVLGRLRDLLGVWLDATGAAQAGGYGRR